MTTTVGMVGLAEAGNLGDDLILLAVAQAVYEAFPDARLRYTSFDCPLDWDELRTSLAGLPTTIPIPRGRDLPFSKEYERVFSGDVAIVFGGGGLIQTSHHPLRPYHWLRFLPGNVPVIACGLGIGPVSSRWIRRLRKKNSPFVRAYLRDQSSVEIFENELGWSAQRCRDFIDSEFLAQFAIRASPRPVRSLGVAIREWPGLTASAIAQHIQNVAEVENCPQIQLFVLESKAGAGPDVDFSYAVAQEIQGLAVEVIIYTGTNLMSFVREMAGCAAAIGMKLHACAIWQDMGTPVYPILYAPKVAALFGLDFSGLEIIDRPVISIDESAMVPRARDVLIDALRTGLPQVLGSSLRTRFTRSERVRYQTASLVVDIGRKLRSQTRSLLRSIRGPRRMAA